MKKLNRILAASIAAIGLGTACFSAGALAAEPAQAQEQAAAQGPGPGPEDCPFFRGGPRGPHPDKGEWKKAHDARIQKLHDSLKLTSSQERAWKEFQAVMDKAPEAKKPLDPAEFDKLPAPEKLQSILDMRKAEVKEMEDRVSALKTFYAKLTPEQQKTFDSEARPPRGPHHGGPRGPQGNPPPPPPPAQAK